MTAIAAAISGRPLAPAGDAAAARLLTVAYYTPGWPPGQVPNGVVSYIGSLLDGLRTHGGVEPWVITPRVTPGAAVPAAIATSERLLVLPSGKARGLIDRCGDAVRRRLHPDPFGVRRRARQLGKAIRRLRRDAALDLVEVEEWFGLADLLAPAARVPLVVRLHGPCFLTNSLGPAGDSSFDSRDEAEGRGLLAASAVSAPSMAVLRATREHFGLELPHAAVIHNPVPPVNADRRWSLEGCHRDYVLFVGRFERVKGGDTAIDAFARIAARHPTCRLIFAGPDRGCVDDAGKRWLLPEYISAKLPDSARERVEWLGFQPHEKIAALRQRAMVTIVPSRYETFGIAAVEAMAAGCPVVTSDVGGLAEIVRDGQNAVVARTQDADDFAAKVLDLLEHPQRAAALGGRAAADAAQFHPDVIAARTVALYRETVERFHRGGLQRRIGTKVGRTSCS